MQGVQGARCKVPRKNCKVQGARWKFASWTQYPSPFFYVQFGCTNTNWFTLGKRDLHCARESKDAVLIDLWFISIFWRFLFFWEMFMFVPVRDKSNDTYIHECMYSLYVQVLKGTSSYWERWKKKKKILVKWLQGARYPTKIARCKVQGARCCDLSHPATSQRTTEQDLRVNINYCTLVPLFLYNN